MKITKMQAVGGHSTTDFPIVGARPSDRFQLLSVDGLGPVELDVSIAPSLETGGVYMGRQAHTREIVMLVGLQPNWAAGETPESLRTELYGLLSSAVLGDYIYINLFDGDTRVATTIGVVSKIEINPFTKDPQAQITFECPWPNFTGPEEIVTVPSAKSFFQITNPGTASTGFEMTMQFTGAVSAQSLFMGGPGNPPWFGVIEPFIAGDLLTINTQPGLRKITKTRGSTVTNIVRALTYDSNWLKLYPGINSIWTYSQAFNWGEVKFTPEYAGI